MLNWFSGTRKLEDFDTNLSRENLIRRCRILLIDDDVPFLIEGLRHESFAVDHDRTGSDFETQVSNQLYDLIVLDYSGVGTKYGPRQGLDLLKYLRRASPRSRILAYTSQSLKADESDFYRLADGVLLKDAGLAESFEVIEGELRKALSKEHLFESLLTQLAILGDAERAKLRDALIRSLTKKDQSPIRSAVIKYAGKTAEKAVEYTLAQVFS